MPEHGGRQVRGRAGPYQQSRKLLVAPEARNQRHLLLAPYLTGAQWNRINSANPKQEVCSLERKGGATSRIMGVSMRKTLILVLTLTVGIVIGALGHQLLNAQPAASPVAVDVKGQTGKIGLEQVLSGHLTDVNGKYKLRVTDVRYEPGGYTGEHQHRGPGIRFITAGELTLVQAGKATVYKAGDYFFEAGDITNAAYNKGNVPLTLLNFELLPADLKGGSAFVPLK